MKVNLKAKKSNKQKLMTNKGITLIALVITICWYELNNLGKNRNKILEKYRKTKALSI